MGPPRIREGVQGLCVVSVAKISLQIRRGRSPSLVPPLRSYGQNDLKCPRPPHFWHHHGRTAILRSDRGSHDREHDINEDEELDKDFGHPQTWTDEELDKELFQYKDRF